MTPPQDRPQPPERPARYPAAVPAAIGKWQAWRDRAAGARVPGRVTLVEGRDPHGATTVRIDERWRVVAVRVRNGWRDVVGPAALGAAVIEAVADAVQERLRPALDALLDLDALPAAETALVVADPGHERVHPPGLRPVPAADLSIDAVEAQLAEIDRELTRLDAPTGPPPAVLGRSRRHEVEVELGLLALPVRITCRPDWLCATSADRLTSALAEAFVDAYAAADADLTLTSMPLDGAA